jgi:hypothetical protein
MKKDCLSVLDLTPDDLVACLTLAKQVKRDRPQSGAQKALSALLMVQERSRN